MRFFTVLMALFTLGLVPGCMQIPHKPLVMRTNARPLSFAMPEEKKTCLPPITVWIHGTRLLPQVIFKNFFYSKPGLNHYANLGPQFHQHKIAQMLIKSDPEHFAADTFYLFGWNGKLSFKERELAARKLYTDLRTVRTEYKKRYGATPSIQIVAHSHGGNVALLLDKVKDPSDTEFAIDQLILLATPIQKQTAHYAHSSLFGKIYSLYSMLDILQVIDPQGLNKEVKAPLFSERYLPRHEKIEQVAVKLNNRSLMHIEFVKLDFLSQLPHILSKIDDWKCKSKLCASDWAQRDKCICINTKNKRSHIIT